MDPWLELHWRDVHARLIIYIADQLQGQLPPPLVDRAEEAEEQPARTVRPDVELVEEVWKRGSGGVAALAPPVTVAEPILVRAPEPEVDRRVAILDPSSGNRVVTAIEVLSPANKISGRARAAYESKQRDFLAAGVNLVEIDLVRKGDWVLSVDESVLPPSRRPPYLVCVFRAMQPDLRAIYRLSLREELPRIAIPLRPRDRDVALDLQQLIAQAYERGRYDHTDYRRPLNPPLDPEDAAWATELLRQAERI
jgi:hypothetical protein